MAAVGAGSAPFGRFGTKEGAGGVSVVDDVIRESNLRGGVGDVEAVALVSGESGTLSGEGAGSLFGVAGHGLVDEDVFVGLGVAVEGRVGINEGDARESNGVGAFDNDAFGSGGGELGARDGNVGGGIDGGRADTASRVGATGDGHSATSTVGANGRRGVARGGDGDIVGGESAAAGDHDAAGVVGGSGDCCIFYNNIAFTVGEDGVGVRARGSDRTTVDGELAVSGEDGGVGAVKIGRFGRFVAAFGDGGVGEDDGRATRDEEGVLAAEVASISFVEKFGRAGIRIFGGGVVGDSRRVGRRSATWGGVVARGLCGRSVLHNINPFTFYLLYAIKLKNSKNPLVRGFCWSGRAIRCRRYLR